MTQEQIIRSRRRFEIAGSLACGFILGVQLWNMSLSSDQHVTAKDYLPLLACLIITSSCYLRSFSVLRRLDPVSAREVNLHWAYAAILGTAISFIADSVRVWLRNRPDDLFGFIGASVILLSIFVVLMLIVMASVIGAGTLLRRVRRLIESRGKVVATRGI
jgi:hypothetical protein